MLVSGPQSKWEGLGQAGPAWTAPFPKSHGSRSPEVAPFLRTLLYHPLIQQDAACFSPPHWHIHPGMTLTHCRMGQAGGDELGSPARGIKGMGRNGKQPSESKTFPSAALAAIWESQALKLIQ